VPIIICPKALTSVINMFNSKEFLEDCTFIPAEDQKIKYPVRPPLHKFERQSVLNPKKNVPWHIIDDVTHLRPDDWRRVVAVVVLGKEWQFKGWPTKSPAEWFHQAEGFHFYFDDQRPAPAVLNWNVTCMPLSKIKRYTDRSVVMDVWKKIEEFLAVNNKTRQLIY